MTCEYPGQEGRVYCVWRTAGSSYVMPAFLSFMYFLGFAFFFSDSSHFFYTFDSFLGKEGLKFPTPLAARHMFCNVIFWFCFRFRFEIACTQELFGFLLG